MPPMGKQAINFDGLEKYFIVITDIVIVIIIIIVVVVISIIIIFVIIIIIVNDVSLISYKMQSYIDVVVVVYYIGIHR